MKTKSDLEPGDPSAAKVICNLLETGTSFPVSGTSRKEKVDEIKWDRCPRPHSQHNWPRSFNGGLDWQRTVKGRS